VDIHHGVYYYYLRSARADFTAQSRMTSADRREGCTSQWLSRQSYIQMSTLGFDRIDPYTAVRPGYCRLLDWRCFALCKMKHRMNLHEHFNTTKHASVYHCHVVFTALITYLSFTVSKSIGAQDRAALSWWLGLIRLCVISRDCPRFSLFPANCWLFYARKQLLLSARLSHRNSVCPSVRHTGGPVKNGAS